MPKHSIAFSNRQHAHRVEKSLRDLIRSCCNETLRQEGVAFCCELSISFVSAEEIQGLNAEQRGIDAVTDVLSFPLEEFCNGLPDGYKPPFTPLPLGDVVLCLERAAQQAEEYGHSFDRECGFLTVHSILHLLGHDHEESEGEREMQLRQERVLQALDLTRGAG